MCSPRTRTPNNVRDSQLARFCILTDLEWQMTFTLHDVSSINHAYVSQGLKIRFFNHEKQLLPNVKVGDVVSLKLMKVGIV